MFLSTPSILMTGIDTTDLVSLVFPKGYAMSNVKIAIIFAYMRMKAQIESKQVHPTQQCNQQQT
ncbi:hypothetical protein BFX83_14825 [Komagataeibacter xylinus]|nr:hypothetical protein BFX83_14825 [Komagataeibacter xylinus]